MDTITENIETDRLVVCFNARESQAFGQIYLLCYDEFYFFSSRLYRETEIASGDVVQDLFMKIWERKELQFTSLEHLKGYMYVSIRNGYREYLSHKHVTDRYIQTVKMTDDYFISQIVETETLSVLSRLTDLLPEECAKVFKLYLEGWEIKEIVEKLGKSSSTVYNQRQEAIRILKKLDLNKLLSIVMSLSV